MKNYLFIFTLLFATVAYAQPTTLVVRAKAKDAKFIGSSIGGAKVIIRDALTGEILSQGTIGGSTGNTTLIMNEPHERYKSIADDQTAKFEAVVNIEEPRLVTVEVLAPVNQPQARVVASTQLWIIPGKDIRGDGIVLEIPGFIVDVLSPQTHEFIKPSTVRLKANVVMMCGCTISNGGLWDAEKIEVQGIVKRDGEQVQTVPLKVYEKVNTFEADLDLSQPGIYEVIIYAYDSRTGNTGVDKVNFVVNP
ncbi:hypothetical protein C900_00388 [Fulvivirga imtechensis AK7]|uniref:Uncharacterized protein n=1 Tax=Fulvivirga imtechensis AK7 TaxID=1237149 RepID=L8JHX4_9BACT|nr:hypothetical protein [Fulvivirga imtechensis]ELR68420.1 hypothetical protein C900_00388 [Fulvivirga imtechensis AK7]